jgi:uncharacterized protein YndB with AHSA1/START domain
MNTPHDDPPGTRAIRLEVEVPGTPEEVWEAIATGPGITAWFVPSQVEEREGGLVTMSFGPGMDETGRVTGWEPPRRFAYQAPEPGLERSLAFEFLVQARDGGTCVVRLVNTGFGTGSAWDDDYDSMTDGWRLFLDNLRLYRTHFPGERSASIIVNGTAAGPLEKAWGDLTGTLGLPVAAEGERVAATGADAPPLAGRVERLSDGMLTLLLDEPTRGVAFVAAEGYGTSIHTSFYAYLFGPDAAAVVERDEPAWRAWMGRHFPAPAADPAADTT